MGNKLIKALNQIEVYSAIKSPNNRRSVGPDKTSGETWGGNTQWLVTLVTYVRNQCAEIYWMPQTWKQGIITYIR